MSKKLIGDTLKESAYKLLEQDLKAKSPRFLTRVKGAFFESFSGRGQITEKLFYEYGDGKIFGMTFREAKELAIHNGMEIERISPKTEEEVMAKYIRMAGFPDPEAIGENAIFGTKFEDIYAKRAKTEIEAIKERWNEIGYSPVMGEVIFVRIAPPIEGKEKSPAQKAWEEAVAEYEDQAQRARENAEAVGQEILHKITQEDYQISLSYNWGEIKVKMFIKVDEELKKTKVWKDTFNSVLKNNGIAQYQFRSHTEFEITYKMSEE